MKMDQSVKFSIFLYPSYLTYYHTAKIIIYEYYN